MNSQPNKIDHSKTFKINLFHFNGLLKFVFIVGLVSLLFIPEVNDITVAVLADSFWQVAAYVAATLALYSFITNNLINKHNLFSRYRRFRSFKILISSLLGALPGCGGAIIVITQFIKGKVSFGCVVAVLTATMGDAAFLLLTAEPKIGLLVAGIGFFMGTVSGLIVDKVHNDTFMRPSKDERPSVIYVSEEYSRLRNFQETVWNWLLFPSIFIALLGSFQVDVNALLRFQEGSIEWIGAVLALFCLTAWLLNSVLYPDRQKGISNGHMKVGENTNFVLCWVVISFLLFELSIHFTGFDLSSIFTNHVLLVPMIAIIIGFLPGCGPQILVTTFYLSGSIPLSAQLGNALSNDGDALFPAIALAPKAAIVATIYSAIPAMLVAYGYMYFLE